MEQLNVEQHLMGVEKMITKKAHSIFRSLSENDKRWMSPEDLIQDGFVMGLEKFLPAFDPTQSKFSSWCYVGLDNGYNSVLHSLNVGKRRTLPLIELDKPILNEEGQTYPVIPVVETQGEELEAWKVTETLYRHLSPEATLTVAKTFLLGKNWALAAPQAGDDDVTHRVLREIKEICTRLGFTPKHFQLMSKHAETLLQRLSVVLMNEDANSALSTTKLLECVECSGRFELKAISLGKFFSSNSTCLGCLNRLAKNNSSCFAKQYNVSEDSCRVHCTDKEVCSKMVNITKGEKKVMAKKNTTTATAKPVIETEETKDAAIADIESLDFSDLELTPEPDTEETTDEPVTPKKKKVKATVVAKIEKTAKAEKKVKTEKKTVKSEKSEKASTKAKTEKVDEEEDMAPFGPWPGTRNSWFRYAFKLAYEGVEVTKLEKELVAAGVGWDYMYMKLRRGHCGVVAISHTWKAVEEKGILKVVNVKFLGSNRTGRAGRPAEEPKESKATKKVEKVESKKVEKTAKKTPKVETVAETPKKTKKVKKASSAK